MSDSSTRPHASSVPDVARRNGVGRTSIWREIEEGRLVARKIRDRTVVFAEDEDNWLKNLRRVSLNFAGSRTNR